MIVIWEEGWDGVGGMVTKRRMGVVLGEEQLQSSSRVGDAAIRGESGKQVSENDMPTNIFHPHQTPKNGENIF
jgi:hypothetical protein